MAQLEDDMDVGSGADTYAEEDDYLVEDRGLTFDDMVSFTMFTEICVVLFCIIFFVAYLYVYSF